MSVHSHSAGQYDTATPEFPRHVVTAVLVSHDGARWLPDALAGLLGQERPVQNAVAADTGSADDSARLVTDALGADRVLHLARRTGFGQAVEEAARTAGVLTPDDLPYLKRPSGWDPVTRTWRDDAYDMPELPHGEPEQWLWLLHDDCAPEADALAQLLRVVENERELGKEVAIIGPKLRGWYDRRQLLEVGVTIAHSGRRWTGLDRREQDQGQHDHVKPVLAVSTAGMLIRRDVFEELGGFDRRLPLMRDDIDLCWRAQAAGHRVLVAPEAVVRHAEASSRERRTVDCVGRTSASPHKVDKAGAVYTLLVNSRSAALPGSSYGSSSARCCARSRTSWARSPDRRSTRSAASWGHCCARSASSRAGAGVAAPRSTRASCARCSRRPARPCGPRSSRPRATLRAAPTRS